MEKTTQRSKQAFDELTRITVSHSKRHPAALLVVLVGALLALPRCGDRVVGLDCALDAVECGDVCCEAGLVCDDGTCREPILDGLAGFGGFGGDEGMMPGTGATSGDGGMAGDGGMPGEGGMAGSPGDGGTGGVGGSGGTGGAGGTGGTGGSDSCPLGTTRCDDVCLDTDSNPNACGDCMTECSATEICSAGDCVDVCEAPFLECDGLCIDPRVNNDYCGSCTNSCSTGQECVESACSAGKPGHVILIGHGYTGATDPYQRFLGNGVFIPLPSNDPVQLLAYEGDAQPSVVVNMNDAIDQVASATRSYERTEAEAGQVTQRLVSSNVFLIHPQDGTTDEELRQLGEAWQVAMESFLFRGGTIIVVDGPDADTWEILDAAGLLDIESRSPVADTLNVEVTDGSDALSAGVDVDFAVVDPTFSYVGGNPEDVVAVTSAAPVDPATPSGVVVFHRDVLQ